MYESEHTRFIRQLLQQNPHLTEEQRKGRALWWDKAHDAAELRAFQEARVKQHAYVYQSKA